MEELLQKILTEVQHLRKDVDTLSDRIDMVATMTAKRFNELESRLDKLEARFNQLEIGTNERFEKLEKKVDNLTKEFHAFRRESERANGAKIIGCQC